MASRSEITISKGNYTVTIYATEINDNLSNKLFNITPPTSKTNQEAGQSNTKVVDLLRITRQLVIIGEILTSSDKSDLINIQKGGGSQGGEVTLSYDGGGDKNSFSGYIEKLNFTERPQDECETMPPDHSRYTCNLTFVEGEEV